MMNDLNTAYQDAKQIVLDSEHDDDIDKTSAEMAEFFLMQLRQPSREWRGVSVGLDDDKQVVADFRYQECMMTVAFDPQGFVTYAYYDSSSSHDDCKGQFTFSDHIPFYILALVNNVFEKCK